MNWLIRVAQADEYPFSKVEYQGRKFETGVPVEFRSLHNRNKSPDFGSQFQQDIEPAGRYVIHQEKPGDLSNSIDTEISKFSNPLVIEFNVDDDTSYNKHSWKAFLSRKFGGLKGKELSMAIAKVGYDGIVTVKKRDGVPVDTGEIVDLRMFHNDAKAMPLLVDIGHEERFEHAGIDRMDYRMDQQTADQLRQQYPEIEYGGAGAIGIAFQTGPNEIMKITHSVQEANAANYVFENNMDWVVPILEKPQMLQEHPPMWGIRMKELQLLDPEVQMFVSELSRADEVNQMPQNEAEFQDLLRQGKIERRHEEARKIWAQMKYILDQNRETLWLPDIHGGNVGWDDDGYLKVFDLGPGDFVE